MRTVNRVRRQFFSDDLGLWSPETRPVRAAWGTGTLPAGRHSTRGLVPISRTGCPSCWSQAFGGRNVGGREPCTTGAKLRVRGSISGAGQDLRTGVCQHPLLAPAAGTAVEVSATHTVVSCRVSAAYVALPALLSPLSAGGSRVLRHRACPALAPPPDTPGKESSRQPAQPAMGKGV